MSGGRWAPLNMCYFGQFCHNLVDFTSPKLKIHAYVQALIQTLSTYVGGANATIGVHETCPYPFTHGKYAWASNMDSIEFQFISL